MASMLVGDPSHGSSAAAGPCRDRAPSRPFPVGRAAMRRRGARRLGAPQADLPRVPAATEAPGSLDEDLPCHYSEAEDSDDGDDVGATLAYEPSDMQILVEDPIEPFTESVLPADVPVGSADGDVHAGQAGRMSSCAPPPKVRLPYPGLNPGTIAEDIARLQNLEASRALRACQAADLKRHLLRPGGLADHLHGRVP